MTENQFIFELEQALKRLPIEERNDILKDIQEYFSDGREAGKAEEEIAKSLGSPKVIASELLEAYPFNDLDVKKESSPESWTIKDDSFTKVDINVRHGALRLSPSETTDTIIELIGQPEKLELTAEVIGDTLHIRLKNKVHWSFLFNFTTKAVQLNVFIPKKLYQSISMKSDNGRIQAEKLIATTIHSSTDNGRINLTEVASSTLNVETDNGRIELLKVQSDRVTAKTDNGRILLTHVEADTIQTESDNGRIELDQVDGELIANTDNGRILLNTGSIDRNIDFQTSNGSIEINSSQMPVNAAITAKTGHGRIDIFGERNSFTRFGNEEHQVKLKSANGRITVR